MGCGSPKQDTQLFPEARKKVLSTSSVCVCVCGVCAFDLVICNMRLHISVHPSLCLSQTVTYPVNLSLSPSTFSTHSILSGAPPSFLFSTFY